MATDQATPTQALLAPLACGALYLVDTSIRVAYDMWTINSTKRSKNRARIERPS